MKQNCRKQRRKSFRFIETSTSENENSKIYDHLPSVWCVCVCVYGMGEWAAHAFPVRVKNIHSLND